MNSSEIVIQTEREAYAVLDAMKSLLGQYEVVTFADFLELVGIASTFADNKIGWDGLKTASVKPVDGGFILDLPPTKQVNG